jgi:hypothetical protein
MSDFLTQEELLYWVRFYAKKGMTPQLPAGYVLASPHDVQGVVAWRKLDAGYISTGVIDPDRLGTGGDGSGGLVLHDDGTWRPAVGCLEIDWGLRSDATVQYDLGNRFGCLYMDFCNRLSGCP